MNWPLQEIVLAAPERWFHVLSSQDMALEALLEMAESPVKVTKEPKVIGGVADIYRYECVQKLAQNYFGFFEQKVRRLPYFTK